MGRAPASALCLVLMSSVPSASGAPTPSFLAAVGSILEQPAPFFRKKSACLPSDEDGDFYRGLFLGRRIPASSYQGQVLSSESEEQYLERVVTCTLDSVHGETVGGRASLLMLDFLLPRLLEGMDIYGVDTRRKKRYYLAQILHESGGLTKTVESSYKGYWGAALKASLRARREDAASGRPLGQIDLDGDRRKGISYELYVDGMFCSEDDLDSLADQIREDFLLEPTTFASNFEHTANALALPCPEGGASTVVISGNRADRVRVEAISSIGSGEFLVDSSLWFWRRHCVNNRRYRRVLQRAFVLHDGDMEIGGIRASSQCVRGYAPNF